MLGALPGGPTVPPLPTALFSLVVIAFVLVSRRVGRLHLTAPIVFATAGWVAAQVSTSPVDSALVRTLAEATLAVVLFHDAAQVRPRELRNDAGLCARLLLVGLPLTMLLGFGAAWMLFPTAGVALWLLLASALAPTDAGLGAPTVLNPVVPVRIRRVLNVESGVNDGLSTPVVLFAIALAGVAGIGEDERVVIDALRELAIGVGLGIVLGALVGYALTAADRHGWLEPELLPVAALLVPLATYYGAEVVGGNGFVAAFVAGTAFAWGFTRRPAPGSDGEPTGLQPTLLLAEWVSLLLGFVVWGLFGYVALDELWQALSWQTFVYAVVSLTVLRMLPVALSLLGTGLKRPSVLFIGWFGPRGLASVIFAVIAVEEAPMTDGLRTVLATIVLTVVLSVVLHGVTADKGAAAYGAWATRTQPPVETAGSVEPYTGRAAVRTGVRDSA
jgi:NhaP-type Na+/H+ or K+/H+ antiporter